MSDQIPEDGTPEDSETTSGPDEQAQPTGADGVQDVWRNNELAEYARGLYPYEAWKQRMDEVAKSLAKSMSVNLDRQLRSMVEAIQQNAAVQQRINELARNMETSMIPVLANIEKARLNIAREIARSISTSEVSEAIQRIVEASARQEQTRQSIQRLLDLRDSGDLDDEAIAAMEAEVDADQDLTQAFEDAAEDLRRNNPWLTHAMARRVVVTLVFLISTVAQVILGVVVPGFGSLPGIMGLDSRTLAKMSGRGMDKLKKDDDAEDDDAEDDDAEADAEDDDAEEQEDGRA